MSEPAPKRQRISMKFDVDDEALSNICLVVQDRKFYCSKHHLAQHSDVLRNMFFGNYVEKDQKEIVLREVVNPDDFQNFLETINALPCLTDENVDGVCQLADLYCAEVAQLRCTEYLTEKTQKSNKEKFELYSKYQFLVEHKDKMITDIEDYATFKSIMPEDVTQLDKTTSNMVLKKSIELLEKLTQPEPTPAPAPAPAPAPVPQEAAAARPDVNHDEWVARLERAHQVRRREELRERERERMERVRQERDRLQRDRLERERNDMERQLRERLGEVERERAERDRLERERAEREEREQRRNEVLRFIDDPEGAHQMIVRRLEEEEARQAHRDAARQQ